MYCDCHAGDFWTGEDYARRWREVRETGKLDPVYETDAYVEMAKRVVAEGFNAIRFDMLNIKDPIRQGYIMVPDGPELGVEIDEEAIAKHIPEGEAMWL